MGLVTEEQVTEALAEQWGMPVVNLEETNIPPKVLELVPQTMAEIYKIMPVSLKKNVLTVAMADPQNVAALDDLRNFLGYDVRGAVSSTRGCRSGHRPVLLRPGRGQHRRRHRGLEDRRSGPAAS